MAGKILLILAFGLGGSLSAIQQAEDEEPVTVSSLPPENKTFSIKQTARSLSPAAPDEDGDLQTDCEQLCRSCNLFGKFSNNSCKCFKENGTETTCRRHVHETISEILQSGDGDYGFGEFEIRISTDEEDGGIRDARCLLGRNRGALQNMLGQDLKDMTTEERLAEFRKRVEALRKRPSVKNDETKTESKSPSNEDATPLFILPVSPFANTKLGEKFSKVENELVNTGEGKPADATSDTVSKAKLPIIRKNPLSPVRRSVIGSPQLTDSSGYSGIKLPSQFLALTKLNERRIDIDQLTEKLGDQLVEKESRLIFSKPRTSFTFKTFKPVPPIRLNLPNLTPRLSSLMPLPSAARSRTIQSAPAEKLPIIATIPDPKRDGFINYENKKKVSEDVPVVEGIIAVPHYVEIS